MPQITTTQQLRSVEIDFYNYEIYDGQKLIARITYDHQDFVTERWVVKVNNQEVFRRSWYQKCYDDISWHYNRGSLPVQQEEIPAATTGNEIMKGVAHYCEIFGLELSDNDNIYRDGQKLGQVGCSDGQVWFIRASSNQRQNVASARNAVVALSGIQPVFFEDLMDKPFDQITPEEWLILGEYEPVQDLVAA